MTRRGTWTRSAAVALATVAGSLLEPTARREWGRAMRAEIDHIDGDFTALRFAGGCLLAGFALRGAFMILGTLRVSPFVLALEMLACFGPLTLGWFAVMFDPNSGVAYLDSRRSSVSICPRPKAWRRSPRCSRAP